MFTKLTLTLALPLLCFAQSHCALEPRSAPANGTTIDTDAVPDALPAGGAGAAVAGSPSLPPFDPSQLLADAPLEAALLGQLFNLALDCVHKEYPNAVVHVLNSDADAQPPRILHPAFYGCFDWHSAVHGHWLLARLAHLYPDHDLAPAAREALFVSITAANISTELDYLRAPGRAAFERPYGLAWLLQLDVELGDWSAAGEPLADAMKVNLAPLVRQAARHLRGWLPKLTHPVRSGTHGQTAFALGLLHDWASSEGEEEVRAMLESQSLRLYAADQDCPLHYEPSGHDFLSACIAEADLLRRILPPADFASWLQGFMPDIPHQRSATWLPTAVVSDPTDGHLVHLDGLNLSRAWMLEAIAAALPIVDPRRSVIANVAAQHRYQGLASIVDPHYAGGHWLGSFATYLVTRRGFTQQ